MRFRITVRGEGVELRGYIDDVGDYTLRHFSQAVKPFGLVMASAADEDYDPFTDWHH
jgi:hypothetical protein